MPFSPFHLHSSLISFQAFYLALRALDVVTICLSYAWNLEVSMGMNKVEDPLVMRCVLGLWLAVAVKEVAYLMGSDAGGRQ